MTLGPGTRFGPYEILGLLGTGGMGEVYRARDARLRRDVALKVLPAPFASDANRLSRFEKEARLASALNHPNIVTIYEVGQVESTHFIAMEMVEGRTLRTVMETPLSARKMLDIAVQAAEGLAKAHAADIVHRDLKPTNLMVSRDGFVKILDFGLSKLTRTVAEQLDESSTRLSTPETRAGTLLGTVEYMSPEQAAGLAADARSDQFSLGLILYEMATGTNPFRRGTSVQTLAAIIYEDVKPIAEISPKLPVAFSRIVERCLAKDADERYGSTRDLAHDLAAAREGLSDSRPLPAGVQPRRLRRWSIGLAGGVALAALALGLLLFRAPTARWWFQPVPPERHLVVLPLEALSNSDADGYLAEGLVRGLTDRLSVLEQSATSFRMVPNAEMRSREIGDVSEVAGAFGANLALTGRVQRVGGRVHLALDLVHGETRRTLRRLPMSARALMLDEAAARIADMLDIDVTESSYRLLTAGGTTEPEAEDFYLLGLGYLQHSDRLDHVDDAALLFRQALTRDPAYALAAAGLCEAQRQRFLITTDEQLLVQARQHCELAISLNEDVPASHVTLGRIARSLEQYDAAVAAFQRALEVDARHAEAYRELAETYATFGKPDEAEAAYRRAIDARPGDWAGHNALGVFLYRHGRYAEAEAQFRTVVELTPDNIRGYSNLGGLYQLQDRDEEATAMLQRALATAIRYGTEQSAAAASNLGTVYFSQGRYVDAARMFERAQSLAGLDYRVWRNLAAAYQWAPGERDKMRPTYARAAELAEKELLLNPERAELHMHLADCYSMLDQPARARDHLRRALELSPDNANLWFTAGNVYEQLGDRERAIDAVSRAIERGYSRTGVRRSPTLERLRADPRIEKLLIP